MFGYSGVSKCEQWRQLDAILNGGTECGDSTSSYSPAGLLRLSGRDSEWLWSPLGVSRFTAETARVVPLRTPAL